MLNLDVIAGFDNRTYPEGEDFPRSRDYFTITISILGHSHVILRAEEDLDFRSSLFRMEL